MSLTSNVPTFNAPSGSSAPVVFGSGLRRTSDCVTAPEGRALLQGVVPASDVGELAEVERIGISSCVFSTTDTRRSDNQASDRKTSGRFGTISSFPISLGGEGSRGPRWVRVQRVWHGPFAACRGLAGPKAVATIDDGLRSSRRRAGTDRSRSPGPSPGSERIRARYDGLDRSRARSRPPGLSAAPERVASGTRGSRETTS